jgi:thymidylate synthase
MRYYVDPAEMYSEVERDLFEMGVRYVSDTIQDFQTAEPTIELNPYCYKLIAPHADKMHNMLLGVPKVRRDWAYAELQERLFGSSSNLNPGNAWQVDSDFWGRYIRNGFFSYTYSERWQWQLPYIIQELRERPNTRQAIMTMYDVHQDMMKFGGRDRVPCSVSYQFLLRDGHLNIIYNQRSCDFINHFIFDVFFTVMLMVHVAQRIGSEVGDFTHFIGSLHSFRKDLDGRGIF